MARDAVEERFEAELRAGRLQWLELDYDLAQHEHFRGDYELVSSNVVVVRRSSGKDAAWQRLDRVWELVDDEAAFRAYVGEAVAAHLEAAR